MGEIHELFVLALPLVWFAGATPDSFFFGNLRALGGQQFHNPVGITGSQPADGLWSGGCSLHDPQEVPVGRVVTYGDIAYALGSPAHARHVGKAFGELPPGPPGNFEGRGPVLSLSLSLSPVLSVSPCLSLSLSLCISK